METFTTNQTGRVFLMRLDPGDFVLESIRALIQKEKLVDAYVASAIGTLDFCVLHMVMTTTYPPVEHFERWENKPLELASIDGMIADGVPHLHTVVSDHQMAYAGHLEDGCRVLYLAEIVIVELQAGTKRIRNENGILKLVRKAD